MRVLTTDQVAIHDCRPRDEHSEHHGFSENPDSLPPGHILQWRDWDLFGIVTVQLLGVYSFCIFDRDIGRFAVGVSFDLIHPCDLCDLGGDSNLPAVRLYTCQRLCVAIHDPTPGVYPADPHLELVQ
jgi:hypothetical protein